MTGDNTSTFATAGAIPPTGADDPASDNDNPAPNNDSPSRMRRTEAELLGPPPDIDGPHIWRPTNCYHVKDVRKVTIEEVPKELTHHSAFTVGVEYLFTKDEELTLPEAFAHSLTAKDTEPQSYCQAMAHPDAAKYHQAACEEIESLINNKTFDLVQLPTGERAIGSCWVFKVKRNPDGSIERYKYCLVGQGFSQHPGYDYLETFAPTPKWSVLRLVLATVALEDLEMESIDILSAFLNGEIDAEIYMKQPEGFVEKDASWVWKLNNPSTSSSRPLAYGTRHLTLS